MNRLAKDGAIYAGSAAAGMLLARSFGAKVLGVALGGVGMLMVASWTLLSKNKQA